MDDSSATATRSPGPPPRARHHVLRFFARRMMENRVFDTAASLSYASMLSLIPALALLLAALAAYPGLGEARARIEQFLLSNLMPDTGMQVGEAMAGFIRAAGNLTAFGVIGLGTTSLVLLISIESAFNTIFRVARARRLMFRLLVFWAVMTVGPLLLGAGFSLFGMFAAMPLFAPSESKTALELLLGNLLPAVFGWILLSFLYVIVPNRRVRLPDAMTGALVAAGLLTILRYTFAFYVLSMTTYQAIYGALAAVPVFLIWIFLVWTSVLIGAVVAAFLPEWRHEKSGVGLGLAARMMTALAILGRLAEASGEGRGMKTARLAREVAAPDMVFAAVLSDLRAGNFVATTEDGRWMLSRELDRTPLSDLVHHFGYGLNLPGAPRMDDTELGRRVGAALRQAADSESRALSVTLGRLLRGPESAPVPMK